MEVFPNPDSECEKNFIRVTAECSVHEIMKFAQANNAMYGDTACIALGDGNPVFYTESSLFSTLGSQIC